MSHAIRYPMSGAYRTAGELYAGLLSAAASAPDDESARTLPEWRLADGGEVAELYALATDRTWRGGRWHVELKAPVQDHASPMMAMHGPERPAGANRTLVVFEPEPGARSSFTIKGTRPRLLEMAETVRKNWTRYGGGPKPAELTVPRAPRRAVTWPATSVKVWRELLEDKQPADALRLGLAKLGGRVYRGGGRAAFMVVAPQQVEGLPDEFSSARRDDGQWVVFDTVSGRAIGQRGAGSRKAAEEHARGEWERVDPARRDYVVNSARQDETISAADALSAWCAEHGIENEFEAPAELVAHDAAPVAAREEPAPTELEAPALGRPADPVQVASAAPAAPAPHPRMAEALAILAAAVQPVDDEAAADAAACADDALSRVYGDAVADAVAAGAAPPARQSAAEGIDARAVHLAALLAGIIGPDPARLATALRRESARVATAAAAVSAQVATSYRRTAGSLAEMAADEEARAAPRPDPAALVAELDGITAAARDRMGGRSGAELDAMTPSERVRRHALAQQLPTFAEERKAARQRIADRVADRGARRTTGTAAPPAAGRRTSAARPALAGAAAGPWLSGPGFPCGDIGADAVSARAAPAGPSWRPGAPAWRGWRSAGAVPAGGGARPVIPCGDIGVAGLAARWGPAAAPGNGAACTIRAPTAPAAMRIRHPPAWPRARSVTTSAHRGGAGLQSAARFPWWPGAPPVPLVTTLARQRHHP